MRFLADEKFPGDAVTAFERLSRYETMLWRQAMQTIISLEAMQRRSAVWLTPAQPLLR